MHNLARPDSEKDFGESLLRFVSAEGSAPVIAPLQKFLSDSQELRDLRLPIKAVRPALIADIAHFLCISHGRHPGIVDHAATKIIDETARSWLVQSINAFASERTFLNKLTVAAGPITRQFGQETVTAVLTNQAKSFEMLATSDRQGCAVGAAVAFVIDWQTTRPLLNQASLALGIEPYKLDLPNADQCLQLVDSLADSLAKRRAMTFGAEQLLNQQRGLWRLIASRHTEMIARN
jgi:hypothetical protein